MAPFAYLRKPSHPKTIWAILALAIGLTSVFTDKASAGGNIPFLFIPVVSLVTITGSQTFTYTGANQSFSVPSGCTSVTAKLWGGGGGGGNPGRSEASPGGAGGYATGDVAVTGGESLTIVVGGGGLNQSPAAVYGGGGAGGSNGWGGSGGGRSAVLRSATSLIVAGGGGAGGYDYAGAPGGGTTGGYHAGNGGGGPGGTQSAGGTTTGDAGSGSAGTGGAGGLYSGGGGGGYYGGAGGSYTAGYGLGGGGGSSFIPAGGTTTAGTGATPPNTGDAAYGGGAGTGGAQSGSGAAGRVVISYTCTSGGSSSDPYWTNTKLLMHADGDSGSTHFIDEAGHTLVDVSNPKLDIATFKYGTASGYFANHTGLTIDNSNGDFEVGTGDFTIEAWLYLTTGAQANGQYIAGTYTFNSDGVSGDAGWYFGQASGSTSLRFACDNAASVALTGATAVSLNTWHHVAATKSGTTYRLFLDGVIDATQTTAANCTTAKNTFYVGIDKVSGAFGAAATDLNNGYLDDLRFTKGIARYTSSFTPATASLPPASAISATENPAYMSSDVLMMHFNGTNGSTTFTDDVNARAFTTSGAPTISTTHSKFGGASLGLNGTSYIYNSSASSSFGLGTGDFTVEYWAYLNNVSGTQMQFDARNSASADHWSVGMDTLKFGFNDAVNLSWKMMTTTVVANTWYHVAWSRQSGTLRGFLNGKKEYEGTVATDYGTTGYSWIGARPDGNFIMNGYIDDMRITKGVARYTTDFTPPTSALAYASANLSCSGKTVVAFGYTGANQTFTVPAGVTSLIVKGWGGGGGGSDATDAGAAGGFSGANLTVTPAEGLTVVVGGGGGAGSSRAAGGGGGASAVLRSATPLVVAGGGGGAQGTGSGCINASSSVGGGTSGGDSILCVDGTPPTGGTQSAAGAAGLSGRGYGNASAGSGHNGGNGGPVSNSTAGGWSSYGSGGTGGLISADGGGGGGGGGYFGGGGGGAGGWGTFGAGGSSYFTGSGKTTAGSGSTAGESTDANRSGAGNGGGVNAAGTAGRVVVCY